MKLRLLLFKDCNRNCGGCCNKDWDLTNLPVETDYSSYDMILLTGGEPMLKPITVLKAIGLIRLQAKCPIIMYTAKTDNCFGLLHILQYLDGLTVTLREQKDVNSFIAFNMLLTNQGYYKSLRLNVFKGIDLSYVNLNGWKVKDNIQWIKNCPLPENEVLKKFSLDTV